MKGDFILDVFLEIYVGIWLLFLLAVQVQLRRIVIVNGFYYWLNVWQNLYFV